MGKTGKIDCPRRYLGHDVYLVIPGVGPKNRLKIEGIQGYIQRKVVRFGNSARVSCPKEFMGQTVYLVGCPINS